ncbi:MAG: alpha/beta hydrolase [Proteobacteria bacterium]|nr:alpha/beta hydrolase [Pseudomonadota bacterium]
MQRRIGKLERPFGSLHYEVTGSGPALVFAHGLGGNQMSWWQQVAHFAPTYTCVAFAHRGFAPSSAIAGGPDPADYAGDLAALIDHLSFADVRLVGQSMGGWTMLEYALAYPDKVKALVLSSTSGTIDRRGADPSGGKDYDSWLKRADAARDAGLAQGVHPAIGAKGAARAPALNLLYRSIDEMAGTLDKEKLRAGLRRVATRSLGDLAKLKAPLLTIAGADDVVFPAFLAAPLAKAAPRGESHTLPDCGHSPYFEHAVTFNDLVDTFLSSSR